MLYPLETSVIRFALFDLIFPVYNVLKWIDFMDLLSSSVSVFHLITNVPRSPTSCPLMTDYPCLRIKPYYFCKIFTYHHQHRVTLILIMVTWLVHFYKFYHSRYNTYKMVYVFFRSFYSVHLQGMFGPGDVRSRGPKEVTMYWWKNYGFSPLTVIVFCQWTWYLESVQNSRDTYASEKIHTNIELHMKILWNSVYV